MLRKLTFLAFLAVVLVFSGIVQETHASDASGADATVASKRAPGGYSNFCETWRVDAERARRLFGACVGSS